MISACTPQEVDLWAAQILGPKRATRRIEQLSRQQMDRINEKVAEFQHWLSSLDELLVVGTKTGETRARSSTAASAGESGLAWSLPAVKGAKADVPQGPRQSSTIPAEARKPLKSLKVEGAGTPRGTGEEKHLLGREDKTDFSQEALVNFRRHKELPNVGPAAPKNACRHRRPHLELSIRSRSFAGSEQVLPVVRCQVPRRISPALPRDRDTAPLIGALLIGIRNPSMQRQD
jgi:hypothetical protein